jgi:hypothetical protein
MNPDYEKYFNMGQRSISSQVERISWEGVAEVVAPSDLDQISLLKFLEGAEFALVENGFRLFSRQNHGSYYAYFNIGVKNA